MKKFIDFINRIYKRAVDFILGFIRFFYPDNIKKFFSNKNMKRIFATKEGWLNILYYASLIFIALVFLFPFYLVLINSFKNKTDIIFSPLEITNGFMRDFSNYQNGIETTNFFRSILNSFLITVVSVSLILLFTSMASWMIVRVKNRFTRFLYYSFVLAMVVPFQLLLQPMVYMSSNWFNLDNLLGINILYVGFGAGLSVFIFTGFIKSIPYEIEEAAMMDGCGPFRTFFKVVAPILKPTYITVAILNVMWIWNDYLLPERILGSDEYQMTLPVAIQKTMVGQYGDTKYDQMMAIIILSIIPVIIFYLLLQKHIIRGVSEGSIK